MTHYGIETDIQQDGSQPETKVGEDVHHHVENHRRGSPFDSDKGFQLHNPIRLASHEPDGCHIIERKACYGKFIKPGKGKARFASATDDDIP